MLLVIEYYGRFFPARDFLRDVHDQLLDDVKLIRLLFRLCVLFILVVNLLFCGAAWRPASACIALGSRYAFRGFAVVLLFNVRIKSRVRQITFPASTLIIPVVGVISGPSSFQIFLRHVRFKLYMVIVIIRMRILHSSELVIL